MSLPNCRPVPPAFPVPGTRSRFSHILRSRFARMVLSHLRKAPSRPLCSNVERSFTTTVIVSWRISSASFGSIFCPTSQRRSNFPYSRENSSQRSLLRVSLSSSSKLSRVESLKCTAPVKQAVSSNQFRVIPIQIPTLNDIFLYLETWL